MPMTKKVIAEIREARASLEARSRALALQQKVLNTEFEILQSFCEHPGLKLGKDMSGGQDGNCELCGKTW